LTRIVPSCGESKWGVQFPQEKGDERIFKRKTSNCFKTHAKKKTEKRGTGISGKTKNASRARESDTLGQYIGKVAGFTMLQQTSRSVAVINSSEEIGGLKRKSVIGSSPGPHILGGQMHNTSRGTDHQLLRLLQKVGCEKPNRKELLGKQPPSRRSRING